MWVCLKDGFVSAVEHRRDRSKLVVRARNPDHLRTLFPGKRIYTRKGSDYAARVIVFRSEFISFLKDEVLNIDYPNFKDAVDDDALHDMYLDMWTAGWRYQRELGEPKSLLSFSPRMV